MASIAQFVKFRVESNKESRKLFQNMYIVRKTFLGKYVHTFFYKFIRRLRHSVVYGIYNILNCARVIRRTK